MLSVDMPKMWARVYFARVYRACLLGLLPAEMLFESALLLKIAPKYCPYDGLSPRWRATSSPIHLRIICCVVYIVPYEISSIRKTLRHRRMSKCSLRSLFAHYSSSFNVLSYLVDFYVRARWPRADDRARAPEAGFRWACLFFH